ncbi:MAG TPA: M4 family metallopeptidase [Candidatus Limnocylindria bacterium]|nr:M4 family metallopeptidase [Candidatus Limnocylindria bacterium]
MGLTSRIRRILVVAAVLNLVLFGMDAGGGQRPAQAQDRESPAEAAARLRGAMGGQVDIHLAEATGVAKFVRAHDDVTLPTTAGSLADKAFTFLTAYGTLFGIEAAREELTVTSTSSDPAGSTVRLAQQHAGLPVFNAELLVNFDAGGRISAVSGTYLAGIKVPLEPRVAASSAVSAARSAVANLANVNVTGLRASAPRLGITKVGLAADEPDRQALAWYTTVTGNAVRNFVYVDAISGNVLQVFEGIHDGLRRENYNMLGQSNYDLAVKCRFEGEPPSLDPDCDNAYTFTGDTYNFFWNGFRRDSFDNRGTTLKSYVHYFSPTLCPNAFWNGSVMTYCTNGPHDDVTGHEISHGVTEFSANLVYAYQPGALNESFSDIFGESIDQMNSSENSQRWVIGEDFIPGGIRDMSDPTLFGDPDSCTSPNYHCASSDNGGVHVNSGVPNKAYYLMVDGGTHNGVTVTGIGLNKAAAIQYRALTRYLSVYSDFTDAYLALQGSCRDLRNKYVNNADPETGGGRAERVTKADCDQVRRALDAVQMTAPVCTDVAPAAPGPLCNSGETVARLFYDDHETGSPGWTESLNETLYTGQRWHPVTDFAASGTHAWRVNDELTDCSGTWTSDVYLISPSVDLTGTNRPVLRFLHDFFTEGGYDGGTVEINLNGNWTKLENRDFTLNGYNGNMSLDSTAPNWTPTSRQVFTGYRTPSDFPALTYAESRVDLTSYVTQDTDKQVQFRFRFGTDFCNGTDVGWYLDDVEVYDCKLG